MFAVPPQSEEGDLQRLRRRPAGRGRLAAQGWTFLRENRPWDADDREVIARATGLYALSATAWTHASDRWFKAFALAYSRSRDLNQALGECVHIEEDGDDGPN